MNEALFDAADSVAKFRRGDPAAARELVEHSTELVAKIVRAYLPRDADREACCQEAFVRAFAKLDTYRADAPWEHWLARIAVNACLDALRARRRRRELRSADLGLDEASALAATLADRSPTADEAVAARETIDRLLETLEPEDAVIVRMLDLEERSTTEVAALLGRSRTMIKVRAFRARRKLREILSRRTNDV